METSGVEGATDTAHVSFQSSPASRRTWAAGGVLLSRRQRRQDVVESAKLWSASERGDLGAVAAELSKGVPVDSRGQTQMTALHRAADRGRSAVVRVLLQAGADPAKRTARGGHTPLHLAAAKGHMDVCQSLLDAGAVSSAGPTNTPLHSPPPPPPPAGGTVRIRVHAHKITCEQHFNSSGRLHTLLRIRVQRRSMAGTPRWGRQPAIMPRSSSFCPEPGPTTSMLRFMVPAHGLSCRDGMVTLGPGRKFLRPPTTAQRCERISRSCRMPTCPQGLQQV